MKRKIRASERVSVAFVWLSAGITIAALFLILGYIIWNGFFYNNRKEYTVSSRAAQSFEGAILVVNRKIKLDELPFDIARNLFADEYSNWKKIDEQDIDLYPYVTEEIVPRVKDILAIDAPGELVEVSIDTESAINSVVSQYGGVALVDKASFDRLDPKLKSSVKVVSLRTIALACNPDVVALKDNHRIGTIVETDTRKLYSGAIANWSELNGYPLPVVMVVPPASDPLYAAARDAGYDPAASSARCTFVRADTMDAYYAALATTPGAAGFAEANRLDGAGLKSIKLARQETGRNLSLAFILEPPKDSGKIGGISTIILNTFAMIFLTLLFAIPPGLFAAIYLVEYAKEGRLVRIIRLGTETLAGIPSIIFGLFGMLVFVQAFGWKISLLSGSLTVTLMILPTIVRTAEEALKSVPHSLQEGSLALGATKVQTIFRVVLPAAFPAIASGVILAVGRALGETAALIYTMGSNYNLTSGLFDSTRTLAVHIYLIIAEGISTDRAFASGTVLIFFILIINTAARLLINRMGRMTRA